MYEFYIAPAIMPYCRAVMLMLCYFCMQIGETRAQKCNCLKYRFPLLVFHNRYASSLVNDLASLVCNHLCFTCMFRCNYSLSWLVCIYICFSGLLLFFYFFILFFLYKIVRVKRSRRNQNVLYA